LLFLSAESGANFSTIKFSPSRKRANIAGSIAELQASSVRPDSLMYGPTQL
jgi:hypothetical protein